MRPLNLLFLDAPGDTVVGTACVEALRQVGIRPHVNGHGAEAIFAFNPHCDLGQQPGQVVRVGNPLIGQSDTGGHATTSAIRSVEDALGLTLPPARTALYFDPTERPLVEPPYLLVSAHYRRDISVKAYPWWQQVVDGLADFGVPLVQVGASGDRGPTLDGCVDLLGQTTLRELLVLARHALGGVGGESLLNHVFGAVQRPFLTLCSGFLNPSYISYPTGRYLSKWGGLACCPGRHCGCARVVAEGDGKDKKLCVLPVLGPVPSGECMASIRAEEVVDEMKFLLDKTNPAGLVL